MNVLAATVLAALPIHGAFLPGKSLGGVRLGATPAQVQQVWGRRHGACTNCAHPTWYFNYGRYEPQGAGVEFRNNRAVAVFTLWQPTGWRVPNGLRTGAPAAEIQRRYGALVRVSCGTYDAYVATERNTTTAYYVFNERVWGFGLNRPYVSACR